MLSQSLVPQRRSPLSLFDRDPFTSVRRELDRAVDDFWRMPELRAYGRFERRIPLDHEVEADKVQARLKNGVLDIEIPKSMQAQNRTRRIEVKAG